MTTVAISKAAVTTAIQQGDNYSGKWVLVVERGEATVKWDEANQSFNQWSDDAQVFAIPALDPDGSGREGEDARDMLKSICDDRPAELAAMGYTGGDTWEFIQEVHENKDVSWAELCEKFFADDWHTNREEGIAFLADEFLADLNNEMSDLYNDGLDAEGNCAVTPRLHVFEWAEN